jgi:hypothetical protein
MARGQKKAMMQRVVLALSGAFWSGIVCAGLGAFVDVILPSQTLVVGAIAFYFLAGWLFGLIYGLVIGTPIPPLGAAFLVGGSFALFPLNVLWLAGEPWMGGKSVAADCLVLLTFFLPAYWLKRWSLRPVSPRRHFALLGLVVLGGSLGVLFAGSEARAQDRVGQGPDIFLLVLDSVRSDHTSFLGYPRGTASPFEDYLPEARVYENAYSTASWTFPSTRDILGVPPGEESASGFPTRLATQGYATLILTDNPHLSGPPSSHFGFEEKRRSVPEWRGRIAGSVAAEVLDRLRPGSDGGLADRLGSWISGRTGPVYVHAHLMNAHAPFRFPPIDGKSRPGRKIEFPMRGQKMTDAERDSIIARYDAGVRTVFAAARRMIETMRARGRPLLVLLTADHGELLGEGEQWFHGHGLEEELLRVPLVAWGEGVSPGRVAGLASNAQLPETILAAARGETAPRDLRTSSGVETVEGAEPGSAAFRISGPYKVVISTVKSPQLFRLSGPGGTGTKDVTHEEPETAKRLAVGLNISAASHPSAPLDEATRKALRSLGYIR